MRVATALLIVLPLLSARGLAAAPKESGVYHIILPRNVVSAGEHLELKLVPPAPKGLRVNWGVTSGTMGIGLNPAGVYRAPYVIPVGTPPAKVSAGFSAPGFRVSVTTEIELAPGSVPGAADCLGPGQSFSRVIGDIEPSYTYLEELPELVHRVDPEYPRSAFARGVEDTFTVHALVCRTGRVLDAYVPPSYLDIGGDPIERDPKLVEAALAAVRQYVFKPGLVAGQPVAFWIATPVAFRR